MNEQINIDWFKLERWHKGHLGFTVYMWQIAPGQNEYCQLATSSALNHDDEQCTTHTSTKWTRITR